MGGEDLVDVDDWQPSADAALRQPDIAVTSDRGVGIARVTLDDEPQPENNEPVEGDPTLSEDVPFAVDFLRSGPLRPTRPRRPSDRTWAL